MSEINRMLDEAASRLFSDRCGRAEQDSAEVGHFPEALWQSAEELGLTASVPDVGEEHLPLDGIAVLARVVGRHAVPLPLVEGHLARRLMVRCGLRSPVGRSTLAAGFGHAPLTLHRQGGQIAVSGAMRRVPWGRSVSCIVALATDGDEMYLTRLEGLVPSAQRRNLAGEPRDDYLLRAHPISADACAALGAGADVQQATFESALMRCLQMAGAMERALSMTTQYATERVQFGRTLSKFQAIQQQIAELATHVAASMVASDAALLAALESPARFEIAAAKTRCGEAAGAVASITHQVHGAMGFTHEHSLHLFTRRLLSWRDEFGSEHDWAMWLGRMLQGIDGDRLWALVTRPADFAALQSDMEAPVETF